MFNHDIPDKVFYFISGFLIALAAYLEYHFLFLIAIIAFLLPGAFSLSKDEKEKDDLVEAERKIALKKEEIFKEYRRLLNFLLANMWSLPKQGTEEYEFLLKHCLSVDKECDRFNIPISYRTERVLKDLVDTFINSKGEDNERKNS